MTTSSTVSGRIEVVVTMNIKDPNVHRLARTLASRRGTTVTGAVRDALTEALEREDADREGIAKQLLALAQANRQIAEPIADDDELYDEDGLPR